MTSTTAALATTAPATTATTSAPSTHCHTSGLSLHVLGTNGGLGNEITNFALTNTGTASCSLSGFPGIELVDVRGNVIPTSPKRGGGYIVNDNPPTLISFGPDRSVFFGVEWSGLCTDNQPQRTASAIRVIPPDETAQLSAAAEIRACPDGVVVVSPVWPDSRLIARGA